MLLLTSCTGNAADTTAPGGVTTAEKTSSTDDASTEDTKAPEETVIAGQKVSVMSYNLDADMSTYKKRSAGMLSIMQSYAPNSIGVQEARPGWMNFLIKNLTGYSFIGVNANGKTPGDKGYNSDDALSTYIFYNSEKYDVVDSGTFWLSKTPDVPSIYSNTVDCYRTCNWAIFRDKTTGFVYAHFNAHLDWMDVSATDYQISLIRDQMLKVIAMGIPVFATGDYNTDEGTSTYKLMLKAQQIGDSKYLTDDSMDIGTYPHYDDYDVNTTEPIDFCFVSKELLTVTKYRVVNDKPDGEYVSDHFGIYCEAQCADQSGIYDNAPLPLFPETAQIAFDSIYDTSAVMSFAAASDSIAVKEYIVSVNGTDKTVSSKFRYPIPPQSFSVTLDGLTASSEYTVSVTAVNLYGKVSAPLTAVFTTASVYTSDFSGKADILDLSVTASGVSDTSAAALKLTPVGGNAAIVKDETSGNYVINFDGSGKNYKASGISSYYDAIADGFTMELYASYADTLTYANMMANFHAGGFGFEVENGDLSFDLRVNGVYVKVSALIDEDVYYHTVVTYDGTKLSLYVNGVLKDSTDAAGEVTFATEDTAKYLCIGADSDATGAGEYPVSGRLMYARIYSVCAEAADVTALYNSIK